MNIEHLLDHPRVTFIEGSITDLDLLMETFPGADGIFHQAAIASVPRSVKDPLASNEANVTGTLNVLVAAKGCRMLAVVAAFSVYGDTPCPRPWNVRVYLHPPPGMGNTRHPDAPPDKCP